MTDTDVEVQVEVARPPWWREIALIVVFYLAYSWVRNQFGSAAVDADVAFENAEVIIDIQKAMGLYFEPTVQGWFLDAEWFLRLANIFYGTLHFIATIGAMVYLYLRQPLHYPKWRTTIMATTGLALIGFATFPLMPPRLLGNCRVIGACVESPFVDTMAEIGGIWSFDSGTIEALSNQYAAMPSLHFGWAFWVFLVLRPHVSSLLGRVALYSYPWVTLFAIVVTANHYWIDALGGGLALLAGYLIATRIHARPLHSTPDGP